MCVPEIYFITFFVFFSKFQLTKEYAWFNLFVYLFITHKPRVTIESNVNDTYGYETTNNLSFSQIFRALQLNLVFNLIHIPTFNYYRCNFMMCMHSKRPNSIYFLLVNFKFIERLSDVGIAEIALFCTFGAVFVRCVHFEIELLNYLCMWFLFACLVYRKKKVRLFLYRYELRISLVMHWNCRQRDCRSKHHQSHFFSSWIRSRNVQRINNKYTAAWQG